LILEQENEAGFNHAPELNAVAAPSVLTAVATVPQRGSLELMSDVPVTLVFEVARIEISVRQLLELKQGSLLELAASGLDSIKIIVDGTPIALGDITIEQRRYGVRVGELLPLDGDESAGSPA
jgi:flagellar motor switch/type III secretory pathway protein FliN